MDPGRCGARGSYVAAWGGQLRRLADGGIAQGRIRAIIAVHHRAKLAAI